VTTRDDPADVADETRRRVIQAAVELLAGGGGEPFSIPAVARRACVSVRDVHRAFPDEDALVVAASEAADAGSATDPELDERIDRSFQVLDHHLGPRSRRRR
jgi:AcrR family transcriptional regulator